MTDPRVHVTDIDDHLKDRLHDEIYRFNQEATGYRDGRGLSLRVGDASGELIAGLTGWTWGGTGYVDMLWVRAGSRGSGWGSRPLAAAEMEAISRGCTSMVLSSHSFQAPDFYRSRGYLECGSFPEYPIGHCQVHFTKSLRPT